MTGQPVSSSSGISDVEYAGFAVRTVAVIVDTFILMILQVPVMIAAYGVEYYVDLEREPRWVEGPVDLISGYIAPAILTVLLWRTWQTTPGKRLFRAYVVDADTLEAASVGRCVIRYLAYFISALPLFAGILWVAFDRRRQGWHDKLANTVVIRRPPLISGSAQ